MTDIELIKYYVDLLIIQYKSKPKARATIEALISVLMITQIIKELKHAYNINTARGPFQDILGKYIGLARTATGFAFDRDYFAYISYDDTPPAPGKAGYGTYLIPFDDVEFLSYISELQSKYELTDEEYRIVQRFKVLRNNLDMTTTNIDNAIFETFGGAIIFTDHQDMSITYEVPEGLANIAAIAQTQDLLPRPCGVDLNLVIIPD
jgi:hypothetical protein